MSFPTIPDFLESDDLGFIQVVGHRIGLNHVIKKFNRGHSAEAIALEFPTLPLATIYKVIGFYLDNMQDVDEYIANHDSEVSHQVAELGPVVPGLKELRRRMQLIQKPGG